MFPFYCQKEWGLLLYIGLWDLSGKLKPELRDHAFTGVIKAQGWTKGFPQKTSGCMTLSVCNLRGLSLIAGVGNFDDGEGQFICTFTLEGHYMLKQSKISKNSRSTSSKRVAVRRVLSS